MVSICPLLIRASFIGRTYHDLQLEFESPPNNCTIDPGQNPLFIQFTRVLNSTSYFLYDLSNPKDQLPRLQIFDNDHVDLCIRSAFDTSINKTTCHEFYIVTMLSSVNTTVWPLLIIFGYIIVLLIAILFSLCSQCFRKYSPSSLADVLTEKFLKNRTLRLLSPSIHRNLQNNRIKKVHDKKEIFKAIDSIAREYRTNRRTFFISTDSRTGLINRAYVL